MYKESITTSNLSVGYGGRAVQADMTFSLREGELVCLLGPNGAGKSTLLRTLAGLQPALSGTFRMDEAALVLSKAEAVEAATVYDVVALGRYRSTSMLGRLSEADDAIVAQSIAQVGLPEEMLQTPFAAHSDGEQQRILIAKALCQQTPVVLLDEPTAHLDLPSRIRTMELLQDVAHRSGRTVVVSTHELDLALRMSDRILLLSNSEPLQLATPQELCACDAFSQAFGMDLRFLN